MQTEVVLKRRGRAKRLWAQEAMQLLRSSSTATSICSDSVSPQRRLLPLLSCRLLSVHSHVSVQQGALYKAAGTVWAGEDGQGEVGKGVPQQGAQGQLGEVAHATAQALGAHMAQQVVFDSLRRRETQN